MWWRKGIGVGNEVPLVNMYEVYFKENKWICLFGIGYWNRPELYGLEVEKKHV